jgi:hypothetical protein
MLRLYISSVKQTRLPLITKELSNLYKKEIDKQESGKQCQFIYTAELCEEKDLEMLVYHIYELKIKQLECYRKKKASFVMWCNFG